MKQRGRKHKFLPTLWLSGLGEVARLWLRVVLLAPCAIIETVQLLSFRDRTQTPTYELNITYRGGSSLGSTHFSNSIVNWKYCQKNTNYRQFCPFSVSDRSLKLSHRCELTRKERSRVGPTRKYCRGQRGHRSALCWLELLYSKLPLATRL